MAETSPKGSLPYGWIVRTSKNYPNRVYYFNIDTGVSTWECPELDPPRAISKEDEKSVAAMQYSKVRNCNTVNKSGNESSSEPKEDKSLKSSAPPTAVVVPVVNKQKELNSPPVSQKKIKLKRKSDSLVEHSHKEAETSTLKESNLPTGRKRKRENEEEKEKIRKNISPLNKPDLEESIPHDIKDGMKTPFSEKSDDEICEDASLASSPLSDNSVKDVEMRDVSVDIIDDLNEKKETVFDASACYYIVIDTNVLIGELNLISELKDTPLDGCGPPHVFIPWVVVEELDKLKSQRSSKAGFAAGEAIRYLNSVLGKHPRFHGQSPAEAEAWAKSYSKCNDDKILECCTGLSDRMPAEKVILLTNDKNLVNKARICNINVHNFESMMKKVKPDTKFNYGEKKKKKKKKEKDDELQKSPPILCKDVTEEKILQSKRDSCKCTIHSIMSNARLLLKDILSKFLAEEMTEAYGNTWLSFPIERKLLKGLLEGIQKYWRTVFYEFFEEKDKRNVELLLEKASRPEGFLGDKDECLVILSAVEAIFRQIQRRQPKLNVPVEKIQEYRVAIVNVFIVYTEAESSFRAAEEKSIRTLLDDNWTIINQVCGIVMDHYEIPHNFDYFANEKRYSDFEIRRIMVTLYPAVEEIKNLLCKILDGVKKSQSIKSFSKRLHTALLEFIPSLKLPYQPTSYPFLNAKALEKWFTSPQNRQHLEMGVKQIELFFSKLDEALLVIMRPCLMNKSPEHEMICD